MTTPIELTVTADVTSSHWLGGQQQATGAWCFAAATATVQHGFGTEISQGEIAHKVLMARGEANDPQQNAAQYLVGVQNLWALHNLNDTSWASVGQYVNTDDTLRGYLRQSWGSPLLEGRTSNLGGRLTESEITTTLDNNGLVLSGNAMHWKVIYGYLRYSDGSLKLKVYDPMNGASNPVPAATVRNDMQVSYRITA
ncbi:hypothetical protein ACN27F_13780 [Solwaraspora sp. WMMB335]|uniref:hypothetical protein n=1 Tax=Solwaraspora sp. WMMB335 TaxID=3404118 RepID=UPI003B9498AF